MTREEKRHRDGKEQANRYSNQSDPKIFISDSFEPEGTVAKAATRAGMRPTTYEYKNPEIQTPALSKGRPLPAPAYILKDTKILTIPMGGPSAAKTSQ
jgi:hypothetical protein